MDQNKPLALFKYRNHHGVLAERAVVVDAVEFIREPGFGYQSGWFVSGLCLTKNERRSFALTNIVMDPDNVPPFFKLINFSK